MGFARACGIEPAAPRWDLGIPKDALEYARGIVTDDRPTLVISPCSSHTARNWPAERYAAVADYAAHVHHMRIVLVAAAAPSKPRWGRISPPPCGSASSTKSARIRCPSSSGCCPEHRAVVAGLGSRHMASMVGLPVIGLYAATNPARAGPYYSRQWCVDKYGAAAQKYFGEAGRSDSLDDQDRTPRRHGPDRRERCHAKLDAL